MRFLELFLLNMVAVAQPVFAMLAGHPEFFAAHEAKIAEIIGLVVLLTCLLPGLIHLAHWLLSRSSPDAADRLHSGCLGLLLAPVLGEHIASHHAGASYAWGGALSAWGSAMLIFGGELSPKPAARPEPEPGPGKGD